MSKPSKKAAGPQASTKLSDPQRKILQNTSRRSDLLVVIRKGHELEARSPISALIRRGFLAETPVEDGSPAWKQGSDGSAVGLAITLSGLQAIGRALPTSESGDQQEMSQPGPIASQQEPQPATEMEEDRNRDHGAQEDTPEPVQSSSDSPNCSVKRHARVGSKRALIIDLLRRIEGVGLRELEAATSWLPHTTRAALTNLRKAGFILGKSKGDDGKTVYRIVDGPTAASQPAAGPAQLAS